LAAEGGARQSEPAAQANVPSKPSARANTILRVVADRCALIGLTDLENTGDFSIARFLRFDDRQLSSQIAKSYGRRGVRLTTHFYGKIILPARLP
jgi:hypothetical protein